jgi:hypothetical protein
VGEHSYFEQAADALRRAFDATRSGEQALLLEEALRLNRAGLALEKARLAKMAPVAPPLSEPPQANASNVR